MIDVRPHTTFNQKKQDKFPQEEGKKNQMERMLNERMPIENFIIYDRIY